MTTVDQAAGLYGPDARPEARGRRNDQTGDDHPRDFAGRPRPGCDAPPRESGCAPHPDRRRELANGAVLGGRHCNCAARDREPMRSHHRRTLTQSLGEPAAVKGPHEGVVSVAALFADADPEITPRHGVQALPLTLFEVPTMVDQAQGQVTVLAICTTEAAPERPPGVPPLPAKRHVGGDPFGRRQPSDVSFPVSWAPKRRQWNGHIALDRCDAGAGVTKVRVEILSPGR